MSQSAPGYPPPYQPPANSGKATTSLVLGIVSLVACGLLTGIPAMVVSRQAKRQIAESDGQLGGGGMATAGFWTGLVGTVLSVLAIIAIVVAIVFSVSFFHSHDCRTVQDSSGDSTIRCDR